MKKYYVYVILDTSKPGEFWIEDKKFDYETFYIGKGTADQIKDTLYNTSQFKKNKLDKMKRLGLKPIVHIIKDNLTTEEALSYEIYLIKLIGRRDMGLGPLVNQTDGGDGRVNSPHSQETKDKISKTKTGVPGAKHTEETKKYLSDINSGENNPFYGKKHTQEVRDKQSESFSGINHPMWGKKHSDEIRQKIKTKVNSEESIKKKRDSNKVHDEKRKCPVMQYDLQGNFIREYSSIKEAKEITNFAHISCMCLGKDKSVGNYTFRFSLPKEKGNSTFVIDIGSKFELDNIFYILLERLDDKAKVLDDKGNESFIHYSKTPIIMEMKYDYFLKKRN